MGCVGCGQCRIECPTGAIKVKSSITEVLTAIKDENSMVVAQIAPAVRVGLGGMFDLPGDVNAMEIIVGAMRQMGFDRIFDTSFGADLTIAEECEELLHRLSSGENLPLMTSCCPAWVRFCEDRYPQFAENISTCRSPHQMLGAAIRAHYKETERVVIVSVMPCTAKKNETQPDVDYVITTSELACLIKQQGIVLADCQPSKTDEPFGQASMDALHFGAAGGVAKAITSHLDTDIKAVSVSGLANATELMQKLEKGEVQYDLVEVMACPGGCIMGGGQPVPRQLSKQVKLKRENALHK
ncbi:MAG: 4Fe-4S binding protein [Defluviitaleaceae bacterium]|nr:4Fe-4S binding protein [Defluviitaleaceae bacterium]